mmetsp:Transcript_22141/g.44804  ORF Transcript_22141/g.44804 Transcript_22141/m.44804 type:complete len:81 (-) Transcript_22141:445-687(-)
MLSDKYISSQNDEDFLMLFETQWLLSMDNLAAPLATVICQGVLLMLRQCTILHQAGTNPYLTRVKHLQCHPVKLPQEAAF